MFERALGELHPKFSSKREEARYSLDQELTYVSGFSTVGYAEVNGRKGLVVRITAEQYIPEIKNRLHGVMEWNGLPVRIEILPASGNFSRAA